MGSQLLPESRGPAGLEGPHTCLCPQFPPLLCPQLPLDGLPHYFHLSPPSTPLKTGKNWFLPVSSNEAGTDMSLEEQTIESLR